jgi:maltose/moltooligosaccharide transporter
MKKPPLRFAQIWNMNFGFFGIQFGWGLQMANMSAIYEYLGAKPDQIPMLWLAAPLTGLIVQPIIGQLSDHTWGRLGRRLRRDHGTLQHQHPLHPRAHARPHRFLQRPRG